MSDLSSQMKDIALQVDELIELVPKAELPSVPPKVIARGNPASFTLQQLAKEHTEEAFETILEIMNDRENDASTRLEAAKQVLDRGWGKPSMRIDAKTVHVDVHKTLKELSNMVKEPPKLTEVIDVTVQEASDA